MNSGPPIRERNRQKLKESRSNDVIKRAKSHKRKAWTANDEISPSSASEIDMDDGQPRKDPHVYRIMP